MKSYLPALLLFGTLVSIAFSSCTAFFVSTEYVGQWKSDKQKITVRTHDHDGFKFTSDSADFELTINADNSVSGRIGLATFSNGQVKKNGGPVSMTGIIYIVKCGTVGPIFSNDPLTNKEVELWLYPIKGSMEAELRYTDGMAAFPMAGVVFTRKE
jgi:hypothetical protein